jgi:quinol monooxygenase YgiN
MPYIRISLMTPAEGKLDEVRRLDEELSTFYQAQDGCLQSFVLTAADGSGELGRMSIWESETTAEHAATLQQSMSLRSRLHLAVKRGHVDRSFLAP